MAVHSRPPELPDTEDMAAENLAPRSADAPAVAVSVSESPDMRAHGMSRLHLRDLMGTMAVDLLADGRSLAYGGDLRADGFPDLLFQSLIRYRGHPDHRGEIGVTDYLAWPVHIRMTREQIVEFRAGHGEAVRLAFLARDGSRLGWEQRLAISPHEPDDGEWREGLTAMRAAMREETAARVVAGGRIDGYRGRMPDAAEETLLSLKARQPVFLIGGFGGCARGIAETMGLAERVDKSPASWNASEPFSRFTPDDLRNGLSREENSTLAGTPHIDEMVTLVSWGLWRILDQTADG